MDQEMNVERGLYRELMIRTLTHEKSEGPFRIICTGPTKEGGCGKDATHMVEYSVWIGGPITKFEFCDECYGTTFGENSTREIRSDKIL